MYRYDFSRASSYPEGPSDVQNLSEKWKVETDLTEIGRTIVDEKYCYFNMGDKLFVRNKNTGEAIWEKRIGNAIRPSIVAQILVGVASANGFYMYNKDTGDSVWEKYFGGWIPVRPLIYKGNLFLGANNKIYCLNALNGLENWSYAIDTSPDAVANDLALSTKTDTLFVAATYALYAMNINNGAIKWRIDYSPWDSYDSLVLDESNNILFGAGYNGAINYTHKIDKIDTVTRQIVDTFVVYGDINSDLAYSDSLLYFTVEEDSGRKALYCVEVTADDMVLKWTKDDVRNYYPTPSISNNILYVVSNVSPSILCLDATTGDLKKEYALPASYKNIFNIFLRDGKVYFSDGKYLQCLE